MKSEWKPAAPRIWTSRSGVAAVEFALLAPLLVLFYTAVFETGRGWLAYMKFESTVQNAARYAARYPEFERRVRVNLPLIIREALAPLAADELKLTLFSLKMSGGKVSTVFAPYAFYGAVSDIDISTVVTPGLFTEGEAVIALVGSYSYRPIIFDSIVRTITFEKSIALNPFFSRSYEYNKNDADWDYYNVR